MSNSENATLSINDVNKPVIMGSVTFTLRPKLDVEPAITQVLENNVHDLESLRAEVERLGLKDTPDVREIRNIDILRGIDRTVDYIDLVELIQEMKSGIARRRVALMSQ